MRLVGKGFASLVRKSRVAGVAVVVACLLAVGVGVDGCTTAGRAYQGVHVGSVDASGMTRDEIISAVDDAYTQPLRAASVTVFASDEAAAQTAEAASQQDQQDAALAGC